MSAAIEAGPVDAPEAAPVAAPVAGPGETFGELSGESGKRVQGAASDAKLPPNFRAEAQKGGSIGPRVTLGDELRGRVRARVGRGARLVRGIISADSGGRGWGGKR